MVNEDMVRSLLENEAQLNATTGYGIFNTALARASCYDPSSVIQILLKMVLILVLLPYKLQEVRSEGHCQLFFCSLKIREY